MGLVTVGTPGQPFYALFDTGSSDLWVAGTQCGGLCGGYHTFNRSLSSTCNLSNTTFSIEYGDGNNVTGMWAVDTVSIGDIAIANQPFAIANSANGMSAHAFDATMGMGYQQIATGGQNPVIWSMYLAGKLTLPLFGFWFGSVSTGSDTGELILGGYDKTKYTGCFVYAAVSVEGYWEFVVDSISLSVGSNTTTIATSFSAILDTGTTLILAPLYYVNMINSILEATYDPTTGWYTVNCQTKPLSAFPNITVTISSVSFVLTPLMYILIIQENSSSYTCNSVISWRNPTDMDPNQVWIFGDYFLRRFYSIFDMKNDRIGLAISTTYSVVQSVPNTLFNATVTLLSLETTTSMAVITTPTLPAQCYNYTIINDSTRLTTAPSGGGCDMNVFNSISMNVPTFVRFISPGGTQLATSPPNSGQGHVCGTVAAGWTNATYPSVVGQSVSAFACFAYNDNPCFEYVYSNVITNCNGFYVHGLYAPGACSYRYCTQ